ncbi:unnamed protein product [Rotaria socialis]|uniref:Uncharacterized protein n=3 Tax=Rotaria socialis TaxID=392032 RepID=A0A818EUY5_9BILA|nr:unnamed protein product [Rotaria socialis]
MKIQVLLVTIAMLYCSCKNGTVNGMAILNTDQVTTASHQPIAELMKPKVLIEPRILTTAKPVYDKAVIPNSKVNNASKKSTAEPINAKPQIEPRILTAKKPVDDKAVIPNSKVNNASNKSTAEPMNARPKIEPRILTAKKPVDDKNKIPRAMNPKHLIDPRILTAPKPVYDKAVIPNSKVNNASNKSTAEPVNARPLIEPRILTAKKPVDDKKTTPDFAVDYSSDQSETALEVRSDVSSVNLLEALENPSTDLAQIQKNLQFCASARCSRIYCENNLPAIPTQRICCPRCVTNPKCDASECPTLKCRTYIIPADFSTDECCDRCAPTSANDADQTKISKHLRRFRNGTPKYGKSSESHHSSSSSSSSSEKDPLRYIGCLVPPFENQPKHCESVFMQLIGEITVRLHDEEYDGFDDMSDSGGMFMDK